MSTTSVPFLSGLQVTRYFNVAGLALWAYDYCITFETEMRWVWRRPLRWNIARITFIFARYMPFMGSIIIVYIAVVTHTGNCAPLHTVSFSMHIVGIIAAEGLLIHQTYTFWNGSKRLLLWLLGLVVILIALAIFTQTQVHAPSGYPNPGGCLFFSGRLTAIMYGLLLFLDIILLCLIVCSSTTLPIYRDAMIYIGCIILLTLANILVTVFAPVEHMLSLMTCVPYSLLSIPVSSPGDVAPAPVETTAILHTKYPRLACFVRSSENGSCRTWPRVSNHVLTRLGR